MIVHVRKLYQPIECMYTCIQPKHIMSCIHDFIHNAPWNEVCCIFMYIVCVFLAVETAAATAEAVMFGW